MFGWDFLHDGWVHLIWAVLAIVGVLIALELRGRDALARFLSPEMQRRLALRATTGRTIARLVVFGGALTAGVLAIMRPQATGQEEATSTIKASADVIVVLDVSRSMLAEDVEPSLHHRREKHRERTARAELEHEQEADDRDRRPHEVDQPRMLRLPVEEHAHGSLLSTVPRNRNASDASASAPATNHA